MAYGDKAVGTNHVLPTLRGARYTGGLWVGKFLKTCTYQQLTEEGTRAVAPAVEAICEAENFAGHGLTATMRLERARVRAHRRIAGAWTGRVAIVVGGRPRAGPRLRAGARRGRRDRAARLAAPRPRCARPPRSSAARRTSPT